MGRFKKVDIPENEVLALLKKGEHISITDLAKMLAKKIKKTKEYVLTYLNAIMQRLLSKDQVIKCDCNGCQFFALA